MRSDAALPDVPALRCHLRPLEPGTSRGVLRYGDPRHRATRPRCRTA